VGRKTSFYYSFLVLPADQRRAIVAVWDFCRAVDDAVDEPPEGVDATAVRSHLAALPGVAEIHDLHIWGMSTTETALTCHLVMPGGHPGDDALVHLARDLNERFGIAHATIQVEVDEHVDCALEPDHVV